MLTDNIKSFTVILSYLDKAIKKDVADNLTAFSNRIDQRSSYTTKQQEADFSAFFATKMFERIYGHDYYFPEEQKDIQKYHVRDRKRMIIIVSAVRDFAKATKEERIDFISSLTQSKQVTKLEKFMKFFSCKNR